MLYFHSALLKTTLRDIGHLYKELHCYYYYYSFINYDHRIPFLDVLIDNNCSHAPITSVYRKKTFTGLFTNYFSFTSYSYRLGLIRTLVDRTYKINNTWAGFHKDIKYLIQILKNLFPTHLSERVINQYVTRVESEV